MLLRYGSAGKESACNVADLSSILGFGRSLGEGNGYPLQYSGLENSMDYTVHGVTKNRTQLSDFHFHFSLLTCEMSTIVWYFEHFLALSFFGIEMKTDLLQFCGHCWVFQICWHIECSTFTASSFRIWNSSAGIPSPPVALLIMMLPKAHWLRTQGCLALGK